MHRQRAVVLAVGLRTCPAGEGLDVLARQRLLVEAHVQEAARDVRLDRVDAVEPQQFAADLVHAAAALRGAGQHERQFQDPLGHVPSPSGVGRRLAERSSGPCSTCSRVMSSSTRMCASSGA